MQQKFSKLGTELGQHFLKVFASQGAATWEDVLAFLSDRGVTALDDQEAALDAAKIIIGEKIEASNREDEQAFEANRAVFRAWREVRRVKNRQAFDAKYAGHTYEDALELDLVERTAKWRRSLAEEQELFDMSLAQLHEHFRSVGDGLGQGIDTGIMETVVALTANGIPTTSSCEGHLDRGQPYPWAQISHQHTPKFLEREDDPLDRELERMNEPVFPQVEQLLAEFYGQRKSSIRLCMAGGVLMPDMQGDRRRKDLLEPGQAEMQAFTVFLLERARQSGK